MHTVALCKGDGIGPEISDAVVKIVNAATDEIRFEEIEMGLRAYENGHMNGISDDALETINRTGILLKAPISTPQGSGYKSVNVTIRKLFGLFANVRPARTWTPWIKNRFPLMDLVIVRENEEDTYAGIEHRQTQEVQQCLKLISRSGSERTIRYAFELARLQGRDTIHCFTKDNIMKKTDGMFHSIFNEVAKEYPEINSHHMIIDIGAALLADKPEMFDVIVTQNLYGDIISDIAGQISGSVGLCGSSNIGMKHAMFEAVHGTAPDIAGRNIANPSGLLHSAIDMLCHLGYNDVARRIFDSWCLTISNGYHTKDIENKFTNCVLGTQEFTDMIIRNLGFMYAYNPYGITQTPDPNTLKLNEYKKEKKKLVGVDIFVDYDRYDRDPNVLAKKMNDCVSRSKYELKLITNRGVKVYPNGNSNTLLTDHWRCRFMNVESSSEILSLMMNLQGEFDVIKTENLYTFDGVPGYSVAQGE